MKKKMTGKTNIDLQNIYASDGDILFLNYNKSSDSFSHQGLIGEAREGFLKDYLLDHLPHRIAIDTGQIVGPMNGKISNQIDLVLYDHINCPVLSASDNGKLFPIESVFCVVEVKSRLSKSKLKEGLENIQSVKNCVYNKEQYLKGVIFAYDLSGNSLRSLTSNLEEFSAKSKDMNLMPDMVVVLNKGIIFRREQ